MQFRTQKTALRAAFFIFIAVLIMGLAGLLSAQTLPQSGSWRLTAAMSQARTGAAAAAMKNGSVLVTGGVDGAGAASSSSEIYGPSGTFTQAAPMNIARTGHTATWLPSGTNGYVLVTGGTTTDGSIAGSAELYDPAANSWTLLAAPASTGAAATPLPNSSLLLSGGVNSAGLLSELQRFDLATQQFSFAGALPLARKSHAACALLDGRVLIVGGVDEFGNTLASTEIYDPIADTISPGPALNTPRANATATTLLDGKVLIAGGRYAEGAPANGNIAEVDSAEIFDPAAGTIAVSASHLAQARAGHQAFLLPNNNNVLLVGGLYNSTELATSELYTPWQAQFAATGTMSTARSSAAGAALFPMADGQLLVAGGSNLGNAQSSAELYSFATVKTEKGDYAPGESVMISGSGWQPNETVSLYMQAIPDTANVPPLLTTTADASGNILDGSWAPDQTDLGARFYLTGVGAGSGAQAQNTFTDNKTLTVTFAGTSGGTVQITDTSDSTKNKSCSTSCTDSLGNNDIGTVSVTAINANSYFAGWSGASSGVTSCTGTGVGASCNFSMGGSAPDVTATFNPAYGDDADRYGSERVLRWHRVALSHVEGWRKRLDRPNGLFHAEWNTCRFGNHNRRRRGHPEQRQALAASMPGIIPRELAPALRRTFLTGPLPATLNWRSAKSTQQSPGRRLPRLRQTTTPNSVWLRAAISTGAVSYGVSGGCSITGNTVTMTSGTTACVVTANVATDINYNAGSSAPPASRPIRSLQRFPGPPLRRPQRRTIISSPLSRAATRPAPLPTARAAVAAIAPASSP